MSTDPLDEDNEGGGVESQPENLTAETAASAPQDDFATMPEPPAPPAFEVEPTPPKRPSLSSNPQHFDRNLEKLDDWVERTRQFEDKQIARKQQKDFLESRRAHNAEARKISAATGAQFNYDKDGVAQPRRDPLTGEQAFTKRISPVRWDEQGRPFQVIQNEQGTRSERIADPDADAPIGPNPMDAEDKSIYRKTKYQPWEAIDPEEGINSKDGRVVKASAQALFDREKTALKRERDEISLRLRDPRRPNRLSPEARQKVEAELQGLAQPAPPPAEVKGMFGGVNIEATEAAKKKWQEGESLRAGLLNEKQALLAADDERAGLENRAYELDQNLFSLEKTPLSQFVQERRKKKAESLAALDPEAARAEIENRGAAIAEEDAATETAIQDLQRRSAALNERTKKGITIQEMESVAAERAAIEADAASIEERVARRNAAAGEVMQGVEAIKAREDREREEQFAQLDRQAAKYPELSGEAKALRSVDSDYRARMQALQSQPEGEGKQAAIAALNQEFESKHREAATAYGSKLEKRMASEVGAAIEKVAGPGGALGFKSQIEALEKDSEIDPDVKKIASEAIREQAIDALIRSNNMGAVKQAVDRPEGQTFEEAYRISGYLDPQNKEDRAKAAKMLEQDPGLGAKIFDGFDRVMTTFGARIAGSVSAVGKAISYRLGLEPENLVRRAFDGGYQYKVETEKIREDFRDPRLETDDAVNRWIMPAVAEAVPNLAGMALAAIPVAGPGLAIAYNYGGLWDEAYSQASNDESLSEEDRQNAAAIYATLALPAETLGDVITGGIFTSRMIPKAVKKESASAALKFWSKFSNVSEVWDKMPPVLKRGVAVLAAGGTEGVTEVTQDKILDATIQFIKSGDIGASVKASLEDNRGALDTFIIASLSGGGIKTLETATRSIIEKGQDPEPMARRYAGVADSFRTENVVAFAEQAGVSFDTAEYEKLSEQSAGLSVRLDRINPKDKVARNDVARELASVNARRLTMISEILGKESVDQAMAGQGQQPPAPILPENIAAMQAEIGQAAPERQAPLASAIKILSGAPIDSLTKAEQDAIKPHMAKVGGQTVLTDDILTELSQTSPQAAALMQQGSIRDEATQRLEILSTEKEGGETNEEQIQQKGPENVGQGIQSPENASQNDQGIGTGTLTTGGAAGLPSLPPLPVGRGGALISKKEKKVADTLAARLVQAGADKNASQKFADYFIKRETLKGWGTEKLNAAVIEFQKAGGMQNPQAILASIQASDATQGAEIDNFTNEVLKGLDADPKAAAIQPQERAKVATIIRNQIAPSLLRYRPVLQGIVSYFDKTSDSDLQVNRAEKLLINSAALLSARGKDFWANTENADVIIDEEIAHISQIKVIAEIRRERTGEEGAEDMDLAIRESEEIFLQLPQPLQEASRKIYGDDKATPGQSGMEFFRQMLQGDIAISEGRVLDRNGKVLTELAANDRPWIEKMKSMLERLFKVFTDLRGNLGTMLRDEGRSEAEVEELTARVERIRKDSLKFFQNLKKEGDRIRGEAYGQEYARQTAQYTAAQPGGREGAGRASSGGLLPTTADGRPSPTPGGTDGRNAPAGNALGQDQAARLAELEGREAERQAREERAKERRAEYVATRAGDLKNYEKVVESTPEDAREPVRQLLGQAPSGKTGYVLAVNQRRLPSTWVALPPGVVQTSHIGPNFQKNPEYAGQNTRAYDTDPAEQNKVRAGALPGALNEDILTSTDPSSANSAPQVAIVIDAGPDGQPRARWQAAGGNAREMMSNLAPQEDQDRLSQTWSEKGAQFGFEAVPEGFRGYRFLGTFDIRTEAGARDYQKLVDDLNPATGVVQDVSDRADLDAKNIPLDLVGDLPVMMSGKEAVEGLSRLLTAPGNIVERNRIEPMVKNPAQAQAYMQRMMFTAGLGQPKLTGKIADYQLQNRNAAFVELSADSAKAAIALRQNGNPGIADALGGLLSNVADYLDEGRSLKTSLELASSQIEMDAMVGDTAPAVEITKRLVELVVVDKRGRVNSEATSAAMKDYMVALASGISRASEDAAMGDMFGAPMTMAERLAAINAAHRRQPQPDSETTLSAATSRNARRMRELELKRRQEGLTRYESDELARLEQSAGQQFMDFFEEARDQRFELEQEVERRGIERAPAEQMDFVLSAAPSFNRTKAAARLKESTRQRKKDTQSRIEELKKAGGEYPHRMDGNWRSDWKITSPGRKLRAPNSGAEFVVQSINIPEDKVTLVRASSPDQPGLTMGIKEAQKRFEVELNAEELEIEPYFISRLTDMAQMKKDFDRAIKNIAAGQKEGYALIPALKGAPRALEKIGAKLKDRRQYTGDVDLEKLIEDGGGDILRASVVVDSADQIQQTIADILHTFAPDSGNTASTEQQDKGTHIYTSGDGMVKIWMEDRFNVPLASGYSDINIKIQLLPGYWAELQVHIPEMLVVKEGFIPDLMPDKYRAENLGVPNGVGHKLYEEYRAPGTTEERKAYLEKQMAALYALAIRKYLSRTSANSSQATSRTKGAYGLGSRGSAAGPIAFNPTTSTRPSGVVTFGVPSSSQNFAPSGNISRFSVSSFIPSSPTREAATSQPVSTLLNLARKIATKAHKNQFRKDGKTAYIEHIRDVVNRLENADENIRAAAWLHDVVEDNPNYSFQEIKRLGVPEEVIAAVRLLTKSQNQSVASYYKNIRPNPIATAVKIADMLSNLADDPSEKQRQRYQAGLKYLQIPTTDIEVFNQDTTLAAARSRRKASDDQLAFDFEAPAVQEYKTALEADGITHPVAQAAAAQQDLGIPAGQALDLFQPPAAPAAETPAPQVEVETPAEIPAPAPQAVSNDTTLSAAKSQNTRDSKAPNGRPSNLAKEDYDLVRTPEFKEWSGDWEVLAVDAAWKKTVEDYYLDPNRREPLSIGRVPPVLRIVGVSDAPMVMPPSVIQKVTVKKHTLTREMVEQIPSALRDPIFVFNSATAPDSVTVLTDIRHEGSNVIAAIHMDRPSPRATANIVVSLHERPASQIEKWIKDGLILYANQGKARAYFRSARLQLPREGSKAGNSSLRTEADVVNRFVNPADIAVQTDENGEPLASEVARYRQEKGISDPTLAAARRQTYDPNQLELDFDAAPRDEAAAQEDSEKSAADRFQSGLDSVMALAASYANIPGVDMDEVRQTARIALADAARSFDPSRAVPFGPYASIVVRNRLNGLYRRENLRRERIPQSLDEPMPGDFTETRQDYTPDTATPDAPTMASRNEARRLIDEMISTLPERMRAAVDGYLQQRQQDEIGQQFGISKQAVSRLQQEGFKRLRQKMAERGIGSVAELLTAATGTPQDDGDFIEPGESFESDLENLLNDLNGVPADIDNAVEKQEQAALEEGGGQRYQVGRPDLAFGANNPDVRGLDQFYTDRFLPETEAQWETAARDMVAKDFEGTRRSIEQAGLSGQTISPELTKAADQIANSLRQKMLQTGKDEDRRAFNVFWYAYRATGTEAGRALASRRDPFKTPAMRHREFLLDLMLTPGKKDKKEIDAETDPAKKAALIDRVTAALLQKLKDAGITPEDILGNRVVVGLNNAEIQRQFRAGLTPKQAEVFDLLLRKNQTPAQIAQRTGMKPEAVEAVFTAFKNRMRQQHLAKFKAGIHKQSEVTLGAAPTQSGLFGGEVSDAEAEAAFDQWFSGMVGTSDTKKIGRPKFRLDDPAHVMRLARAIQSARGEAGLGDMAYEWWIMNILSGPQTQSTNIAGNAGFLVLDTTLQRGVEALVNVFVRDKKAARLGEFRALARGILPGITKGLSMAAKAWSAEHDFYEHTVLGTPLELGQWDKLGNTRAAIPGKAGRVIRIPGRALLFADSFFKQLAGQMNVAAFAYRIAKAEGLRGQALTARVAQLSKTRGEIVSENLPSAAPSQEMVEYFARQLARRDQSLDFAALVANRSSEAWELAREQAAYDAAKNAGWSEDAWVRAVEKSKELTFQQDLKRRSEGGSLFEDAAAKIQDARFNNQLIGFFYPFVKTPYNIFRTGIRKSPLGSANLAWQAGKGFLAMKDGKAFLDGDPTLVRDLSEQLIAWTAMALIFGAVQGDDDDDDKMLLITGSQPRNPGLRDLNARATGGDYVIRIGGRNGVTIPYGRFDPIATVLGTTVDTIRAIKRKGTPEDNMASLWNYMVAQTESKTFLAGFATVAELLDSENSNLPANAKRAVLQFFVPNVLRQPFRNTDDYVRDTKTAPATYTLLPAGNLAEPKVDVYGNEIRKGSNPVMRLFFASPLATEPVLEATDQLLMNWNRANPSMAYAPQQAKAVYKGRDGKEVEMTAEETSRFRLAAGRLASVKLRAVSTPARVANPTEQDIQAVKDAFEDARREVRERMFAGR